MGRKKSLLATVQNKAKGKNGAMLCVCAGTVSGILAMFVLILLFAAVLANLPVPLGVFSPAGLLIGGLGSAASGFVCSLCSREKGFFYGIACGGILFVILLAVSVLAWNMGFGSYTWVKFFTMLLAGALGGIFGVNT